MDNSQYHPDCKTQCDEKFKQLGCGKAKCLKHGFYNRKGGSCHKCAQEAGTCRFCKKAL